MERFLLRKGDLIETRPIKGTRPRGETLREDTENLRDLTTNPKDDAELSMIVDLLRTTWAGSVGLDPSWFAITRKWNPTRMCIT